MKQIFFFFIPSLTIEEFVCRSNQTIKVGFGYLDEFPIKAGIGQRSVLSIVLFAINVMTEKFDLVYLYMLMKNYSTMILETTQIDEK